MADQIAGLAILNERSVPARLHFVCVVESGKRQPWTDSIPVRPKGTPEIGGTSWEFEVTADGQWVNCRPSVKMSYQHAFWDEAGNPTGQEPEWREYFHNAGEWGVRFERWAGAPADHGAIYTRLVELNPTLLTREFIPPALYERPDPKEEAPIVTPAVQRAEVRAAVSPALARPAPARGWRSNRGFQVRAKR